MGCQKATQSAFFGESCSPRPFAKDGSSSIKHAPNVAFASGQDPSQVVENWQMHFRVTSGWESLDTPIDEVVLSMETSWTTRCKLSRSHEIEAGSHWTPSEVAAAVNFFQVPFVFQEAVPSEALLPAPRPVV